MRLSSKGQAVALMAQGWFGNAPEIASTLEEAERLWGRDRPVVARSRAPASVCLYEITTTEFRAQGLNPADYYFQIPIVPATVTMNAELMRLAPFGWVLRYSMLQAHMRPALELGQHHAFGLRALSIVRHLACPRGLDCIMELLEMFEDHVVEFTTFDRPCGTLGWRTMVWEVRAY